MTGDKEAPLDEVPPAKSEEIPTHDRYIHSDIFEKLVLFDEDLVGLVAYGLYQKRKREWIGEHLDRNKCSPSEDDVKAYSFHYQLSALEALRREAEGIMYRYGEEYVQEKMPELQEVAFNQKTSEEIVALKGMIKHISGYWHHIFGHIAGFVILVLLFYFFTRIIAYEPSIGHFLGIGQDAINPSVHNGAAVSIPQNPGAASPPGK